MKQGSSLVEIRNTLEYQNSVKHDYDISPYRLNMTDDAKLTVRGLNVDQFECSRTFHNQMAEKLNIPIRYYNRMLEKKPALLAENVNRWLHDDEFSRHLTLRTFQEESGNTARALLSDRYRIVDHIEVSDTVFGALAGVEGLELSSTGLTEDRLYYKYVFPKVQGEIRKGDIVQAGFVITNSETGLGACSIMPMIYRLVCTNGMVIASITESFRKFHIGKRRSLVNDINIYVGDDENILLTAKINDFIQNRLCEDGFKAYFDAMVSATEAKSAVDSKTLLERTAKKFGFNETEAKIVLEHYVHDDDKTLYGLSNAITRASQDLADYGRASEFEALGWTVLKMPSQEWKDLNEVA